MRVRQPQVGVVVDNKTIAAGAGSYAVTGTNAALVHGWVIAAGAGSYALTGTDVAFIGGTPSRRTTGGWLTAEQAAAQLREMRRRDKQEADRQEKIKAKARELEETIADAYAKATGKPRLRKALEGVEAPSEFTPETVAQIGQEIARTLSMALEGTGRRFSGDRVRLEQLQRQLMEFEVLLGEREAQQRMDNEIAAILLLGAM